MENSRSIRYFEMQQERNPEARFFLPLADLYMQAERFSEALSLLEPGSRRHPSSISAKVLLGQCYAYLDRQNEAADVLAHVLAIDPGNTRITREYAPKTESTSSESKAEPDLLEQTPLSIVDEDETADIVADFQEVAQVVDSAIPETFTATGEEVAAPVENDPAVAPLPPVNEIPVASQHPDVQHVPEQKSGVSSLFVTSTLADIYLAQNHRSKALRILYQVLADHPERDDIAARINEIEATPTIPNAQPVVPESSAVKESETGLNKDLFKAWLDRETGGETE